MELCVQMSQKILTGSCDCFHRVLVLLMLGLHGWSTGYVHRIPGAHVSEPQPLNWEYQSSSCRGDFGYSCGKAGRRGRIHGQCLVLDWC